MKPQTVKPGIINLDLLPSHWGLVACGNRKQPYQKAWQRNPLSVAQVQSEINAGRCHAVGVLCGTPSGGLLFLDHDGPSCQGLVERLAGEPVEVALPQTLVISSGRPGRAQYVYRIPEMFWGDIATHKIPTGAKGDDGKPEQLEFRWDGCQSVVMGAHPITEGYHWLYDAEAITEAPLWMVEQMLGAQPSPAPEPPRKTTQPTTAPRTDADWAREYLAVIPPTEDYDTWLHVGMALHSASPDLLEDWEEWSQGATNYDPKACAAKWKSFKRSGRGLGTLGYIAKRYGWTPPTTSTKSTVNKNVNGSVNSLKASQGKGLSSFVNTSTGFEGTPENGEELEPEEPLITDLEWERFSRSMNSPGGFDPFNWLPDRLATLARNDAARNCIDPMAIWAYLLPSVLSMMGHDTLLDMGGWKVPNIIWSLLIGESGTGKSRAKNLVLGPIEKWNIQEFEDWQKRVEDWAAQEKKKAKDPDAEPSPKPKCRRWLVSQSTPEGIVRRLADQENNGVLGYRDEFAGFIKGLTQYTAGKGDGMEMLLETWDGGPLMVDRANEDNSFAVASSRLSLVGGIQRRIFSQVFETAEDSQGILGRFMCVVPTELPYKRFKGASLLPSELTKLYRFIDTTHWGELVPTEDADDLFTEIAEDFNNQRANTTNAQPWIRKLAGQTLRLAMAIHAIECFYDPSKAHHEITADTMGRAYHMAKHYQAHFYHLMGVSAADGLEGALAKVQEIAANSPAGISARDVCRGSGARVIQNHARQEGMKPADFCRSLFQGLVDKGWGEFVTETSSNGKVTQKYKAFENTQKAVDVLTKPLNALQGKG